MTGNQALRGVTVLLAEANDFCASYIARGLNEAGAHVLGPLASADSILSCLGGGSRPALAVLSAALPDGRSNEIAGALRDGGIPYVFMDERPGAAPAAAGERCLYRPFAAFQIVEALEQLALRA